MPGCELVEHGWIGKKLSIGQGVEIEITSLTERCIMTTLPQQELNYDPNIAKTISRKSRHNFGVYAKVIKPGTIHVGDNMLII